MTLRCLLPVFLILLQSGLAAAHAHAHPHIANHAQTPHLHVHDLLALIVPGHGDEGDHDESDHDADAVDLSDMAVSTAPPPAVDAGTFDFVPADLQPAFAGSAESLFPVGLPPSTAGPHRPLYLTFCTLTI